MNLNVKGSEDKNKEVGFSSHLIMVRPFSFYCNQQTAGDNIYQVQSNSSKDEINKKAIEQFDSFVQKLRQNHVKVTVVQDDGKNQTPDSIYPNNWISFHQGHKAVLYPMYALNRRKQRNIPLILTLQKDLSTKVEVLHDYTQYQNQGMFLQGTGSMVLDRQNKIVYAVISQRTNNAIEQLANLHLESQIYLEFIKCLLKNNLGYKQCSFHASQYCKERNQKSPIYHTNVLMGISRHFVLVSLELIDSEQQREKVRKTIEQESKKKVIELSGEQIYNFAGNTLTVVNQKEEDLLVMSSAAYKSLSQQEIQQVQKWVKIVHSDLTTIQTNGGGSARCMLAEVF